jgi:hypothetical protein
MLNIDRFYRVESSLRTQVGNKFHYRTVLKKKEQEDEVSIDCHVVLYGIKPEDCTKQSAEMVLRNQLLAHPITTKGKELVSPVRMNHFLVLDVLSSDDCARYLKYHDISRTMRMAVVRARISFVAKADEVVLEMTSKRRYATVSIYIHADAGFLGGFKLCENYSGYTRARAAKPGLVATFESEERPSKKARTV